MAEPEEVSQHQGRRRGHSTKVGIVLSREVSQHQEASHHRKCVAAPGEASQQQGHQVRRRSTRGGFAAPRRRSTRGGPVALKKASQHQEKRCSALARGNHCPPSLRELVEAGAWVKVGSSGGAQVSACCPPVPVAFHEICFSGIATDPQRSNPQRPTHSDRPTATNPQRPTHSDRRAATDPKRLTYNKQTTMTKPQ